jgi:hypothetical protein
MITDIHREDRLARQSFADPPHGGLRCASAYAYNTEPLGPRQEHTMNSRVRGVNDYHRGRRRR